MQTFVALLRGINVGGHRKLPMADLRSLCQSIGLTNVRTYIQSGNVVLDSELNSSEVSTLLEDAIEERFGFKPPVMVITKTELKTAANNYPFPSDNHKTAHLMFLGGKPTEDAVKTIEEIDLGSDRISFGKGVVYSYLPNGVAEAQIDLAKLERTLGVPCTSRNWRTVQKLIDMTDRN